MSWKSLQRASLATSLLLLAAWYAAVCFAEGPKVVGGVSSAATSAKKDIDVKDQAVEKKPDDKNEKKDQKGDEKKDDDKETTPEELTKRLEFDWNQITVQATRALKQNSTSRSLSIYGQVKIVNEQDILAVSQQVEVIEATDENGKELELAGVPLRQAREAKGKGAPQPMQPGFGQQQQRYYQFPNRMPPRAPWFGALNATGVNVQLQLQGGFPTKLKSVTGNMMVLVGKVMPPVDMAASVSEDWTELGKELSIRLTKADQNNGNIQYQLESKGDEAVKQFHGWVNPQQAVPKTIITKLAFVDEFNQPHEINTGSVFNPNTSGSAGFGNVGRIAIMRFTYATEVHEVAVPFEIKDLDVPTFGAGP